MKGPQTETERALQGLLKAERRRVRQLQAQLKYHKREFRVLSTKVKTPAADKFIALCQEKKTTVHAALKAYTERATDEGELLLW